jgi:hypothetical protein
MGHEYMKSTSLTILLTGSTGEGNSWTGYRGGNSSQSNSEIVGIKDTEKFRIFVFETAKEQLNNAGSELDQFAGKTTYNLPVLQSNKC